MGQLSGSLAEPTCAEASSCAKAVQAFPQSRLAALARQMATIERKGGSAFVSPDAQHAATRSYRKEAVSLVQPTATMGRTKLRSATRCAQSKAAGAFPNSPGSTTGPQARSSLLQHVRCARPNCIHVICAMLLHHGFPHALRSSKSSTTAALSSQNMERTVEEPARQASLLSSIVINPCKETHTVLQHQYAACEQTPH